jgi:hypothetical protein
LSAKHAEALETLVDEQCKEERDLIHLHTDGIGAQDEVQRQLDQMQASTPREKMWKMLEQLQDVRAAEE